MIPFKLFGSEARTKILVMVALLEETYPRELSRLAQIPLYTAQRVVVEFEREGVLATRVVGRNRQVMLDKRLYGVDDLRSFLLKYAKRDPLLEQTVSQLRRRPRRTGKKL